MAFFPPAFLQQFGQYYTNLAVGPTDRPTVQLGFFKNKHSLSARVVVLQYMYINMFVCWFHTIVAVVGAV